MRYLPANIAERKLKYLLEKCDFNNDSTAVDKVQFSLTNYGWYYIIIMYIYVPKQSEEFLGSFGVYINFLICELSVVLSFAKMDLS